MIDVTKITEYDDYADVTIEIEDEVEIYVTIENGEWVTDEPDATWEAERTRHFYDVGGEFVDLTATDAEEMYEVTCEDLINAPELQNLDDGVYKVTADVIIAKLFSGFSIFLEEDAEDDEVSYYHTYTVDPLGVDETILSVSVDNINIGRI